MSSIKANATGACRHLNVIIIKYMAIHLPAGWEWDQVTDVWTRKVDFGGNARNEAVGFSIGNKGYIGTGYDGSQASYLYNDIWEWDPATDTWTRKADFAGGARSSAVGVSIGNKGYIGTGMGGSTIYAYQDFWEYDPVLK